MLEMSGQVQGPPCQGDRAGGDGQSRSRDVTRRDMVEANPNAWINGRLGIRIASTTVIVFNSSMYAQLLSLTTVIPRTFGDIVGDLQRVLWNSVGITAI